VAGDTPKTIPLMVSTKSQTDGAIGRDTLNAPGPLSAPTCRSEWLTESSCAVKSITPVDIPLLSLMYGTRNGLPQEQWARLLMRAMGLSKLRLQVGELPITAGGSEVFKQNIDNEIAGFKQRWDWLIDPLVIAVALEVVVRPNPATPAAVLHDLDNIVRDYLLPRIVPSFGTVSDRRWTIDLEGLRRIDSDLAKSWGPNATPPPGTKTGVTRYEAWRLPPVAGEAGFVSVALVADMDARGDLFEQIDRWNCDWAEQTRATSRHW
jgi:hypothetical protein